MDESFLYFAYGSNMLTRRLQAAERTPSARFCGVGYIAKHQLVFDKVSEDKSGKCDLEATGIRGDRVYGVVFSISRAEESALDDAEGLGNGYRKQTIAVVTANGSSMAVVYIATKKNPSVHPYHWYKALVIAGALEHGLPPEYVERLRMIESKPDPNQARRTRNEALLAEIRVEPTVAHARYFQVNHKRFEYDKRCLCAPDDRRAGHNLLRNLRVGDVLLHYDSRLRRTFARSRVIAAAPDDFRDVVSDRDVSMISPTCAAYHGRHATLSRLSVKRAHLLTRFEVSAEGDHGPNRRPRRQIYMAALDATELE